MDDGASYLLQQTWSELQVERWRVGRCMRAPTLTLVWMLGSRPRYVHLGFGSGILSELPEDRSVIFLAQASKKFKQDDHEHDGDAADGKCPFASNVPLTREEAWYHKSDAAMQRMGSFGFSQASIVYQFHSICRC